MELEALLQDGLDRHVFTAAEALVVSRKKVQFHHRVGKCYKNSKFDLASLTKPLATGLLALQLWDEGVLDLDQPVSDFFKTKNLKCVTVRELLEHRSGLQAWHPFLRNQLSKSKMDFAANREKILRSILNDKGMLQKKQGVVYSDLGFIVLQAILEKAGRGRFQFLVGKKILRPMGIRNSIFFRDQSLKLKFAKQFVPTEFCVHRKKWIQGVVQDENAYLMGGVAGHAGLFGNALAIHRILLELDKARAGQSKVFSEAVALALFKGLRQPIAKRERFVLGFDTVSKPSFFGTTFSRKMSLCHLGFSGTSFVWDLKKDVWVVLLTNCRVFGRESQKIQGFRVKFHNAVKERLVKTM